MVTPTTSAGLIGQMKGTCLKAGGSEFLIKDFPHEFKDNMLCFLTRFPNLSTTSPEKTKIMTPFHEEP